MNTFWWMYPIAITYGYGLGWIWRNRCLWHRHPDPLEALYRAPSAKGRFR